MPNNADPDAHANQLISGAIKFKPLTTHKQNYMISKYYNYNFFQKWMSFIGRKNAISEKRSWVVYNQKCRERERDQRMAVTIVSFGNPSEYEKLQLLWAHGITSVTGLRLLII